MKIGEKIFSNKVRRDEIATVVRNEITKKFVDGKQQIRTKYIAKYDDGSEITFYGFNIGKSIFKYEMPDGQMNIEDFDLEDDLK